MTHEGRMARGKLNYEAGKFLKNSETLEYINSLPKEIEKKPKEFKPKEAKKDAKSAK